MEKSARAGGLVVGIADLQEHHTGDHNAGGSAPGNDGTLKGIVAFVDDVPQLKYEDVGEYKTDSAHYQDGHSILHNGLNGQAGDGGSDGEVGHGTGNPALDLGIDGPVKAQLDDEVVDAEHDNHGIDPHGHAGEGGDTSLGEEAQQAIGSAAAPGMMARCREMVSMVEGIKVSRPMEA